jgi:hypothetical protein
MSLLHRFSDEPRGAVVLHSRKHKCSILKLLRGTRVGSKEKERRVKGNSNVTAINYSFIKTSSGLSDKYFT